MGTPSRISVAVVAILFLCGCAVTGKNQGPMSDHLQPVVKSIQVRPSPDQTILEITSSSVPRYTTFQLVDPPRVIVDIRGTRDPGLPERIDVPEGNLRSIRVEKGETQAMTTRIVVGLAEPADFKAESKGETISIILANKPSPVDVDGAQEKGTWTSDSVPASPPEPRIFVKPGPSSLNQVLGIDFVMLERGKSRLVVTTDKKGSYTLDRQGPKDLVLRLSKTTIADQLTRHLDSTHFHGAVDWVQPSLSSEQKEVSIAISLKEMVPFHVRQVGTEISVDFEPSTITPVEKKIIPLQLAQAPVAKADQPEVLEATAMEEVPAPIPGLFKTRYTGAPMTMDFVNADVTNILRLIGEVSNLNIVWGPDVQGNVSMRLKNVPWDQALDLILANNDLGKIEKRNVIWIAKKTKIAQIEAEEKSKRANYEAELEAKREKILKEKESQKKLEPIITEYIGIDFADADDLKPLIEDILTERGSIGVDARTSTLIVKDVASVIEEAKGLVKQFDTPVKQVMIEARIVDATTDFTRHLGVQWDNLQVAKRNTTSVPFTGTSTDTGWPQGGNIYNPTFSSNAPSDWVSNIGLAFSKLSESGLTATILDAKLALSEAEGTSRIISAPKVIASNGEEAVISRGDSIIIPATENVESKTLDATLSLTVTPVVSYNDFISLDVKVTDDSAPSTELLLKKSIETNLMVKSGETIVIGGIYTEQKNDDESGIPGLRRIPLLGWLFKTQYKNVKKTELLIFLTPTVIPSSNL